MFRKMICLVYFVLVLGLFLTSVVEAADPNLLVWWKLDETSGTTASDSSGNGHDGTLMGDPQWVPGQINGALDFGGDGDHVIDNDAGNYLNGLDAMTFCLWVKSNLTNTDRGFIYFTDPDGEDTCGMRYDSAGLDGGGTNVLKMSINTTETVSLGREQQLESSNNLQTTTWQHYTMVWSSGEQLKFYVNGVLDSPTSNEPASTGTTVKFYEKLIIGKGSKGTANQGWDGLIDDVRIYNRALTETEIQQAMIGIPPGSSYNPSPVNEATDVPRDDVVLSWIPGDYTEKHDVYLGTDFGDVKDATTTVDPSGVYMGRQYLNTYATARFELGQTYYWRIDEVEADGTIHTGNVWSFTVEPFAYPIENVTATASSTLPDMGPENTVNGSGLDANDLHSTEQTDMWLSDTEPNGAWMEFEFDSVYKLHEMLVWNSNQTIESFVGYGCKDVSIEYSVDGNDYTALGTYEFAQAPGAAGYAANTTVDFVGAVAKNVRLTANSNWGGIIDQYSLSEVCFFYIPIYAREPSPASGATDVAVDVTLGFRAGREADMHDVYFSSDWQAVVDGTAPVTTVTENSYGPLALDLGTTYYWRVDEVNEAETHVTLEGNIWDFTTYEYFVVDDFESYDDFEPNRIFDTWIDGWGIPTNGSTLGYAEPDFLAGEHFVETTIVHGGAQSMPYFYDNNLKYSESTMTLSYQQDWTRRGAGVLSLWFRGNPVGLLEDPAGTYTMTGAGSDIWNESDEFRYAYKQLSGDGSIVAQVFSVENTDPWAKAGVMIRKTLDAGSANAMAYITPNGRVGWQYRRGDGGSSTSTRSDPGAIKTPHWVKLTRQGNTITAQHSSDGVNWEDMVEAANPQEPSSRNILMNQNVYIGLALNSHNSGVVCKAELSNVQTTGTVTPMMWTHEAIGVDMAANDPEPMYVALNGSAVVYHDDPSAALIDEWTEWTIDLQEFAAQGVNLANVNTISIGFGDKNNIQAGGSGMVLFDDIRLYRPEPQP